jgi:hypothetical protein
LKQRVYNGDKPTPKNYKVDPTKFGAGNIVCDAIVIVAKKNRGIIRVTDTQGLSFAEACTLVTALSVFLTFYLRATATPSNYKQRLLRAACMGNMEILFILRTLVYI